MFALNKYLSAGILFLAVLFVVIDLWSFEDSRDFAKKAKKASIPLSERWQALAAVLPPEGPKGPRVATLPLEGPKGPRVSRPRPRRGRGRLKESDACQRYYMFFTVQPKISIFMAQFKYLNDVQNASKSPWTFIHAILTSCEKIREICRSGEKLQVVEILQK